MESIKAVIEKEKSQALSLLESALAESIRIVEEEMRAAEEEGRRIEEDAKRSIDKERTVRTSQRELDGKRLLSVREDDLLEKLISEAYEELVRSDEYPRIIRGLLTGALRSLGGYAEVYAGRLDVELIRGLQGEVGFRMKGQADFGRGFMVVSGEETIVYDIDKMVLDMKKELKRAIIGEVRKSWA
ncbi:MAG: V-type ATP synthase subunit E family protein [Nitrososphaeria archaeon]